MTRNFLEGWYRDRANAKFAERLEESLKRFHNPNTFRPRGLEVRYMKQRWGSMSSSSQLLLNCRLIQASVDGIDYVITHELCHIAEPHHGPDFYDLLNRVLPNWPKRKYDWRKECRKDPDCCFDESGRHKYMIFNDMRVPYFSLP